VGFWVAKNCMKISHEIAHVPRAKVPTRVEGNRVRVPAGSSRGHRYDREIAAAARASKGHFARIRGCVFLEAVPFFPLSQSRAWARVRPRRAKRSSGVVVEAVRRARERGTMIPQVCHVMNARGVVALGPSLSFPLLPSG
jgi:hypothetical protein